MAAPAPCILEAKVTSAFVLFMLKMPESTPAPTANKTTENNMKTESIGNISLKKEK